MTAVFCKFALAQSTFQCDYTTDIDLDNDGLIEICDLDALNAIRYQLDGTGYRESIDSDKITTGCPSDGCRGYELRRDLNFQLFSSYRDTKNKDLWTRGLGWKPIGGFSDAFSARFEGNGYTIFNLLIDNGVDNIGLFRKIANSGKISALILSRVNVEGRSQVGSLAGINEGIIINTTVLSGCLVGEDRNIGGLVGTNKGTIINSDIRLESVIGGNITRPRLNSQSANCPTVEELATIAGSRTSGDEVGGLVGRNEGIIADNSVTTYLLGRNHVGGLVGYNFGLVIKNNDANGTIRGDKYIGGLVGTNNLGARIVDSYATGNVSGNLYVGGLAGYSSDVISDSYASGAVNAQADHAGGLIGGVDNTTISYVYATGQVEGYNNVGGLIGFSNGTRITHSYVVDGIDRYSAGKIIGNNNVGGLVGWNENSLITESYARSAVSGVDRVGGLVGYNLGESVINSYATGRVTGRGEAVGGLIGWNGANRIRNATAAWIINSYWDSEASGLALSDGGSPRTTAELQSPVLPNTASGTYQRWHVDNWDFGTTEQYPIIKYPEGPNRGHVLPGQYTMLNDLTISGLNLTPAFDSKVFDYRLKVGNDISRVTLIPTVHNSTANISIAIDEGFGGTMSVPSSSTVSVELNEVPHPTLITISRQYQVWVIRPLAVSIKTDLQTLKMNEGHSIKIDAEASEPDPEYRWTQISGKTLLPGAATGGSLILNVPEDFVDRSATATEIVLQLKLSDGEASVSRNITVTVVKVNNGSLTHAGNLNFNEDILSLLNPIESILLMDPDGIGDISRIGYQWQSKSLTGTLWTDIEDATGNIFDLNYPNLSNRFQYRVRIDYTDGQNYSASIISDVFTSSVPSTIYINYLEDLDIIRHNLNKSYVLMRDLDFNDDNSYLDLANKIDWTVNNFGDSGDIGWLPIGDAENDTCVDLDSGCFEGEFDGNGYTISNLQINRDNADNQGLFGALYFSRIGNLGLLNAKVEGRNNVGALSGFCGQQTTIADSYAIGEVSGQDRVGGLAGYGTDRIINSYAIGKVSGQDRVGGLAGYGTDRIINSYAAVRVSGQDKVGGLLGYNQSNSSWIVNSHAHSEVSGMNGVGGLVGYGPGTIINSYAAGRVSGKNQVGGLVGERSARIENSYATARVSGQNRVGGLVGFTFALNKIISSYAIGNVSGNEGASAGLVFNSLQTLAPAVASYWDIQTSGKQTSSSGLGKTTMQLQSPEMPQSTSPTGAYYRWNQAEWDFGDSNQYPILKYTQNPSKDGERACGLSGLPECGNLISPGLRYGLRDLVLANDVRLSPPFDIQKQNQIGTYVGTLSATTSTIRLIPTAIESAAPINIYFGDSMLTIDEGIVSGTMSSKIAIRNDGITHIIIQIESTATVRYSLFLSHPNNDIPIMSLEDLNAIRHNLDDSYVLVRDLDFNDDSSYLNLANKAGWTVNNYENSRDTGWLPIGDTENGPCFNPNNKCFSGRFNGNGYTISNLQINRDNADNQGLFGAVSFSHISNLGLLNARVEGKDNVGALVGFNTSGTTIIGSYAVGKVSGQDRVGGLVGYGTDSIINSHAAAQVEGRNSVGGFLGHSQSDVSFILNSHSHSEVSGIDKVGGLVGHGLGTIRNSYAAGHVNGHHQVGGLVGRRSIRIEDSYATARVSGQSRVGGLVGFTLGRLVDLVLVDDRIINSYAIGEVLGNEDSSGGLAFSIRFNTPAVASYWNTQTSDKQTSSRGLGKTTMQLRSPEMPQSISPTGAYYQWSEADWDFGTSEQYPILKYAPNPSEDNERACGLPRLPECGNLISPGLRYGLRDLIITNHAELFPPFDIQKQNQVGAYAGILSAAASTIRLIPIAMESTARISIIGVDRETIDSGETSAPIVLKEDGITKIIVEVKGTKTARYTLYLDYAYHRVIDEDENGFIDINYLEDLDAIRNQLDSSGYRADSDALKITAGCPLSRCKGYELLRDLDFNDPNSYRDAAANMRKWTGEGAWQPIALRSGTFSGIFKGNNKTIANLKVRESGGLFASVGSDSHRAQIDGLGLLNVDIKGDNVAGISTACLQCEISNSYVIGNMEGEVGVGGLVNNIPTMNANNARISNSYFIGNLVVNGQSGVSGGLIANVGSDVDSDVTITNSYVIGRIIGKRDGGFIGGIIGSRTLGNIDIVNNYASAFATKAGVPQGLFGGNVDPDDERAPAVDASYLDKDIGQVEITIGESKSTVELQSLTTPTGIYMDWDDANWEFGTAHQYPAIKYNLSMDPAGNGEHCLATDIQKRPDACRAILRHQGRLLQSLELSEDAGLSQPFDFATFNYDALVNAGSNTIRLLPTAFNPNATIEISKDGNILGEVASGSLSPWVILNDAGDTIISLVVKDGTRSSYRYQLRFNRLDIVAENIDKDGDGLIDISDVMQLNAIRHRLDGTAYKESEIAPAIYCSEGCNGYELTADLDLAGIDWQPIGDFDNSFNGIFKGNGHTIFNLNINTTNTIGIDYIGLFRVSGVQARIEDIALVNVNIKGGNFVGSIVGLNQGLIVNSYASGNIKATVFAGGLVGFNDGSIVNSYARVDVLQSREGGGLVGVNNDLIVSSYASGNIEATVYSGGLVGFNGGSIVKSYAVGNVKSNDRVGGLIARNISTTREPIKSYYRDDAIISGRDSLIGFDRTEQALKQGVPSDNIYTDWDRTDWHFGDADQYPALLYAVGDADSPACKMPSVQQLSDCNTRLSPNISEHDKAVICHSHLQRSQEDLPYCGALLGRQRSGIIQLDFSKNTRLVSAFNPNRFEYSMLVDSGTDIYTTATAYYGSDEITIVAGNLNLSVENGKQSPPITISDDLSSMIFEVKSETGSATKRYTIDVYDIAVEDGFIMINHLEDLNLMRFGLEEISEIAKACPLDIDENVRKCKGYKLARNLDFNDPDSYRRGVVNPAWTTGAGWLPIGSSRTFTDRFTGNAHTISNLRIHGTTRSGQVTAGLFSATSSGARIENIGLLNVDISLDNKVPILFYVGGLVGINGQQSEIVNSYVIGGNVGGKNSVGGLVGRNLGAIVNSHADVLVSATGAFSGGLVGEDVDGEIHNSYASSMVTGTSEVGGLVGLSTGDIYNSYASGMVTGTSEVGGLVGKASTANVNNSYAIGEVSGMSSTGGLIGSSANGVVNASYWDIETSKVTDDYNASTGFAKITRDLQRPVGATEIYSNWSSDDWYFGTNTQYPTLKYTSSTDIVTRPACREADDVLSGLPICGTLLSGQRTGLSNLARSEQVLVFNPDFDPAVLNYDLILKSNVDQFTIVAWAFNQGATIVLDDDSGTNPRETLISGQTTSLLISKDDSVELTLVVTEPLATTITTQYRLTVNHHPFIDVNDMDEDDDGLIEIRNLDSLNAIRYQLDGSGYKASPGGIKITEGCRVVEGLEKCEGYELVQDIDFNDNARITNWQPIGSVVRDEEGLADCNHQNSACFSAIFDGGGYTISNLVIDRADADHVALFAALADGAQIKNLNLSNVEIRGRSDVGSITAYNAGVIANSHASGTVAGDKSVGGLAAYNAGDIRNSYALNRVLGGNGVGGLVGLNFGTIKNTYATGIAEANVRIGGLVGENGGLISDSYAVVNIVCTGVLMCKTHASDAGGLIGSNLGRDAINSYWDIEVSGIRESAGGLAKTTEQLQSGSNQSLDASGVYYDWRTTDWHFGAVDQYPILKYTTGTESIRACDTDGPLDCDNLQSYGLLNLAIAEVATLSPSFTPALLHYKINVEDNVQSLRLIPTAIDEDAIIRISSEHDFEEIVASNSTSSLIPLNNMATTMITAEVIGDTIVKYIFDINYFSFNIPRDADEDGDGFIEIRTLEDLDAIRNSLDGRSYRHKGSDDVFVETSKGCLDIGCRGYELVNHLDFNDPGSYRSGRVNTAWLTGSGWQPIGTSENPFAAIFKGNGFTISNLRIDRRDSDAGLFGAIDGSLNDAGVEQLGLLDMEIIGGARVGGLAAYNKAANISESYAIGYVAVIGNHAPAVAGGLVGSNDSGVIAKSYAITQVMGNSSTILAGGLVGDNTNAGRIENSYMMGSVFGHTEVAGLVASNPLSSRIANSYTVSRVIGYGANPKVGSLVASSSAPVRNSYWDINVSKITNSEGGTSSTTAVLQSSNPTSPTSSIYAAWDADIWDFGDISQYPILKITSGTLVHQRHRFLRNLFLSGNAKLYPEFDPLIFNYDILVEGGRSNQIQLNTSPTEMNATVNIYREDEAVCMLANESKCPAASSASFTLDGINESNIVIAVRSPEGGRIQYKLAVNYLAIEINKATTGPAALASSSFTIDEGEQLQFAVDYQLHLNDSVFRYQCLNECTFKYQWQGLEGNLVSFDDALQAVDASQAVLNFVVPADIVPKDDNSAILMLSIDVDTNQGIQIGKAFSVMVNKVNNDSSNHLRLIKDRSKEATNRYTVRFEGKSGNEAMDKDSGTVEDFYLSDIRWQRRRNEDENWVNIGIGSPYTIPDEYGYQYRAFATYEDGQGYVEIVKSEIIAFIDIDDEDDDGLVEINYLEDLDAIRVPLLQDIGYRASANLILIFTSCPRNECKGYELARDLDFKDPSSYRTRVINPDWIVDDFSNAKDIGWQPIGTGKESFDAIFKGNGFTISNLQINGVRTVRIADEEKIVNDVGLFSTVGTKGRIEGLGIENVTIKGLVGENRVGGLAGQNKGTIFNSYVIGGTKGVIQGNDGLIGGLVGLNNGVGNNIGYITNSYANIDIEVTSSTIPQQSEVGGLVGKNRNGGEINNSYAKGDLKGACIVGALVGSNSASSSKDISKISKIRNSYATGNATTGIGTCSNSDNKIAGGLVASNVNSIIANSYARGEVLGVGGVLGGMVASIIPNTTSPISIAQPTNSYWDFDSNCRSGIISGDFPRAVVFCYGSSMAADFDSDARLKIALQFPTMPNVNTFACINKDGNFFDCAIYKNWKTKNWDFGTSKQFPALRYGRGPDTSNPACGTEELPGCNLLLPGQTSDELLLNSLSLSVDSRKVRLFPSFKPERFNYDALVEVEIGGTAVIDIVANANENVRTTMHKDGGEPLLKRSDGSVQISTNAPFQLRIQTEAEDDRGAVSYQIKVRLKFPPQPSIYKVLNEGSLSKLNEGQVTVLNERDTFKLDASTSLAKDNARLNYRWSQISGKPLLLEEETTSTIEFTVPADFVKKDKDNSTVVIKLELGVSDDPTLLISREIPLTINKIDNGELESSVKWISNETLSAVDLSSDIDGPPINISYIWSIEQAGEFLEIPAANRETYTPSENDRNSLYRLFISYTDGQGYETSRHYSATRFDNIANHADKDGDGLIEIENLEDLNAIRYQLNGAAYKESTEALANAEGCPKNRCIGYKLVKDLDFLDTASYSSISNKVIWTTGEGWLPIDNFNALFDGNGHTIANLMIHREKNNNIALFGVGKAKSEIRRIKLINVSIAANRNVGALVGNFNGKRISDSYASGTIEGRKSNTGGLVGRTGSIIENSYTAINITGINAVGGLVGFAENAQINNNYAAGDVMGVDFVGGLVGFASSDINNSYAAGRVRGSDFVGGLVGISDGRINDSYAIAEVSGNSIGGLVGGGNVEVSRSYWETDSENAIDSHNTSAQNPTYRGFSSDELKSPIVYGIAKTKPYYNWSARRWDFGTPGEYPALRYYDDSCNTENPLPVCGKLLLHQRIGLRDIKLERAQLFPKFSSTRTSYAITVHADASELSINPIAANSDARITIDDKPVSANNSNYRVSLNSSDPTTMIIRVSEQSLAGSEAPVEYRLKVKNYFPKIVSLNQPSSVNEGERVELRFLVEDLNGDKLRYRWGVDPKQLSDITGVLEGEIIGQSTVTLSFKAPEDLLDATQDEGVIKITLTAEDALASVNEEIKLTIIKRDNGSVSILRSMLYNFTYTFQDIKLSDDPDGINPSAIPRYQWQRRLSGVWSDIAGATEPSYTIGNIVGDQYRMILNYADGQGYQHHIESEPVSASVEVINSAVAAANTDLESLSVGNHIIVLDDDETNYSVTISEHTAVTTITASAEYQQAEVSIQIDDRVTKSVRTAAEQISLDEGQSKEVEIVVSENNEMTTKHYILHVFREKSSDKRLSRLAVSPGRLLPQFDFNAQGEENRLYYVELSNSTPNTVLTGKAYHKNAELTIMAEGEMPSSPARELSQQIELDEEEATTIIVVVTAQNMTSQSYLVNVSRAARVGPIKLRLPKIRTTLNTARDYRGKVIARTTNTEIFLTTSESNRSVHSIKVGDSEYIKDGNNFISLTPDDEALISDIIPLKRIDETVIEIVMRVPDQTADGYTEESYSVTIAPSAILIHIRVFPEGLLR